MEDLTQEFFIEKCSINVGFLNIRTGAITADTYLVSITEIVSDCQQIGTGALLIINNYTLCLLWSVFFYLAHIAKMKLEEHQPEVQQVC